MQPISINLYGVKMNTKEKFSAGVSLLGLLLELRSYWRRGFDNLLLGGLRCGLLCGGNAACDLFLDCLALCGSLLLLGITTLLLLLVFGFCGKHLLDDALFLNEEGANNTVPDLVVAQDTTVGTRNSFVVARSTACGSMAESLGTSNPLVPEHPRSVHTLRALREVLDDKAVARSAYHLGAVATGGVHDLSPVRNARAAHFQP